MVRGTCKNCNRDMVLCYRKDSRDLCKTCYKKLIWNPALVNCPRCKRMKPHHARGLCNGCYNSVFNIDNIKLHNTRKYHNIDYETYKKITKACVICGFDKMVDLHHIDMNHSNNDPNNLTGLCPNHHKMVHHRDYQKEVFEQLREKGFSMPEGYKSDNLFKQ